MSEPTTHFVEIEAPTRTPCGLPIVDGQIFVRGVPKNATTIPGAVTCDGCSIRADEVKRIYDDRNAEEAKQVAAAARAQAIEAARRLVAQADSPHD